MKMPDHWVLSARKVRFTYTCILLLAVAGVVRMAWATTTTMDCEKSMADWWLQAVKDVGFPSLVAGFLLFRTEPLLREMHASFDDLREILLMIGGAELVARWKAHKRDD